MSYAVPVVSFPLDWILHPSLAGAYNTKKCVLRLSRITRYSSAGAQGVCPAQSRLLSYPVAEKSEPCAAHRPLEATD